MLILGRSEGSNMDDKWSDGQKNRNMSILYNCVTTVLH